jgi:hypothetical protein
MNGLRQEVKPGKFLVLLIPFLVAFFVIPRIMQYEPGDGLTGALHKGNIALSELMSVTIASVGVMVLLDLRQRKRRRW